MSDQNPGPEANPAATPAAPAAAPPAAPRPAPPPRIEAPSLPPDEMISDEIKTFLREKMRTCEEITVEVNKTSFTGRVFRTMIHEGWIALEHVDGRRKAFMLIEGGKIRSASGRELVLPGGHGK